MPVFILVFGALLVYLVRTGKLQAMLNALGS